VVLLQKRIPEKMLLEILPWKIPSINKRWQFSRIKRFSWLRGTYKYIKDVKMSIAGIESTAIPNENPLNLY